MEYSTTGKHIIVDAWGINFELTNDVVQLKQSMEEAIEKCGATILSIQEKQFSPNGVTILFLLAESHFSIHTYPEKGFAAIDCFTCGETIEPIDAINYFLCALSPEKIYSKTVIRGLGEMKLIQYLAR